MFIATKSNRLYQQRAGYGIIAGPYGEVVEFDTFTCGHCQKVVVVKKDSDDGCCRICWSLICPACVDHGSCSPWEKELSEQEKLAAHKRMRGY